ncbi:ABC transporter substrate-binding protein [Laceyella sacchari]|uniref:ABC transporter substrate-binding protein n=1 Tax=Laceyella sacchari TaxID=37482 RepID=A0ABY5U0I9_LACSH|nr:ABC transporter substrate-binding protein [Laceyella sacchari]TCW38840.1 ABC-type nitrate/sulfonate/bicarbonate transport system substrate-binding protein [Laceyella sacchari]UWE03177.1 ABC transporter substrate-binding protein [Laceyella sacchari]
MKKQWWKIGLTIALCLSAVACGNPASSGTTDEQNTGKKITLVLDWTPNTNHTGLYVAKEKGYFKQAGLDVDIIQPGESGAEQMVAGGKADFGVSYQEAVTQARVQKVPIVSIAAVIQHNTSGFASPVSKNIQKPKDFEGKTYGGFGSPVEKQMLASLMQREQADVNKVNIINTGNTDFFTAVKRNVDFMWIYYGWTGIEAELKGQKLNMIYLTDYAKELDYYTPVLITNEQKTKQDPATVKAFMKAVSQGYQFAIKQPKEAADILSRAEPDLDPKLVQKSQAWLSPRYQGDAPAWGVQKKEVWSGYAEWMKQHGLLEGSFQPEQAFTNAFLPEEGK